MPDDWKRIWKELFVKSVGELPQPITLSYSGGFDSSIILYSLLELDRKPKYCVTFKVGNHESKDLYFTKKACKLYDIKLLIADIPIKSKAELIEDCRTAIQDVGNSRQIDVQCATAFSAMLPLVQTKDVVLGFYNGCLYKSGKKAALDYSRYKRGLITEQEHKEHYRQARIEVLTNKNFNHLILMDFISHFGHEPHTPFLSRELFQFSQSISYEQFHFTNEDRHWLKYFLYELWKPFFDKVGNHHNKNNMHVESRLKEYHENVLLAGTNFKNTVSIYNKIKRGEL